MLYTVIKPNKNVKLYIVVRQIVSPSPEIHYPQLLLCIFYLITLFDITEYRDTVGRHRRSITFFSWHPSYWGQKNWCHS